MQNFSLDRDLLATHLRSKMDDEDLSIRSAAVEIGCSSATLGRMLQGSEAPNFPEGVNLVRASSWLQRSISDFDSASEAQSSTIADVEAHLRGLKDLPEDAVEGIIAMVRATYDARKIR